MTQFAWHIHHDILLEPLTSPIEERIAFIKRRKPAHEQGLRLRLLKLVEGTLPDAFEKAGEAFRKAGEASEKAWEASEKARGAYDKARGAYDKAGKACILALHAIECPNCPWDGNTIFPKEEA